MKINFNFIITFTILLASSTAWNNSITEKISTDIIIIGDSGKDNDAQKQVSSAMVSFCKVQNCDFGLLAGDNIYPEGMSSAHDPILETVFTKYYNELEIPFLVALGNHDYGKLSNDWKRGSYQLEYAKSNSQYYLPSYYYIKNTEHFVLAVLDTTRMMWSKDIKPQAQMVELAYQIAQQENKWFFVMGHHPYLSNGNHGNAGNYERIPFPDFISGAEIKKFVEKNVCGKAQFYISGHDHNLQITDGRIKDCNTEFIVSGSAASTEPLDDRNEVVFEAEKLGYFYLSVGQKTIHLKVLNENNETLFVKFYQR